MGDTERNSQFEVSKPEFLDPHHFYAAYIFDNADTRQTDVVAIIEEAKQLGYPVRYWWLSDAMKLADAPDRLIVCVHHPSGDENAGMDLYERLKQQKISSDELEAASVEEYRWYGKTAQNPADIHWPDGTILFGDLAAND